MIRDFSFLIKILAHCFNFKIYLQILIITYRGNHSTCIDLKSLVQMVKTGVFRPRKNRSIFETNLQVRAALIVCC